LHSVAASLLDPQAEQTAALAVGQPSRVLAGDMRFGALIRQQVLTSEEPSSQSSGAHSIAEADCSPTPTAPARNAVTGILVAQTMGSILPQAHSLNASRSASEGADPSGDPKSPPGIGGNFGCPAVAERQQNAATIRPTAAASAEVDRRAAAGSADDAMQARERDAGPAAVQPIFPPPPSSSASFSRNATLCPERDAPAGTNSSISHSPHDSGLIADAVRPKPSSAQLNSTKPAEANSTAASGTTVLREGEELDLATAPVVSRAKPAVVPSGGKESASNPSTVLVAAPAKPAVMSVGGKKPQTDLSAAHVVLARSNGMPTQPTTSSELSGATNRPIDFSGVSAAPVAAPVAEEKHGLSSPNNQPLPAPNPYTNPQPLHSASRSLHDAPGPRQIANSAAILSEPGRAGGHPVSSRSIAVAPVIQADSADPLNAALSQKMDHIGLQMAAADSMVHAVANPRLGLNQSVSAVSIVGTHATSATSATRPPAASIDSPHAPTGATFERMDSAAAPQVIENSSRRLAVGVRNADLGWVEIRTSNAAGQVSATLATASVESHNAVSAQLPSMREYLAGQQVRVDHLASESFSPSSDREASPGEQSRDSEGTPNAKTPEQSNSPRASIADANPEDFSYVNVRV
jgi:flagellar hook-length control protein FliK